mmetsp:Transcript_11109/g.39267  ORF Transcript_11109/g.39267 Transcript_11109/m.39267 type:complete len:233 (+) Transcript_11109:5106-5804(+)
MRGHGRSEDHDEVHPKATQHQACGVLVQAGGHLRGQRQQCRQRRGRARGALQPGTQRLGKRAVQLQPSVQKVRANLDKPTGRSTELRERQPMVFQETAQHLPVRHIRGLLRLRAYPNHFRGRKPRLSQGIAHAHAHHSPTLGQYEKRESDCQFADDTAQLSRVMLGRQGAQLPERKRQDVMQPLPPRLLCTPTRRSVGGGNKLAARQLQELGYFSQLLDLSLHRLAGTLPHA